jgi:hypothetical protein
LTFDGHLFKQVCKYGGLADKSDEVIERWHQVLKKLRERFRNISSYEQREQRIRRELRRQRSGRVQAIVDEYHSLIKQSSGTKRATEAKDQQESKKRAKLERREAAVGN